jgi:ATP-binding cassette subfamily B protein
VTRGWIARLAAECARHRALLTVTLAVTAVGVAIDLAVPLVTKAAIDTATGTASHGLSIATLGGALVVLGVVRFVAQYFRRLTAGRLSLTVQNVLRTSILSTLLRLDGPSVDRIVTGQVVSRSISDLQLVQGLLAMVPLSLGAVVQVVLAFVVMAYLSPLLTVVALLVIPLVAVVAFRTRRSLFAATWSAQQTAADVAQHVEETVTGVRVVKGFGQEERSVDELADHGRRLFSQRMRAARINARFSPTMNAIPQLALVAIVALGGILTARGEITVGTFLAFATYVTTMTGLARLLTNLVVSAQLARAAVERVYDVIDHPTDPRHRSDDTSDVVAATSPGTTGIRVTDVDVDLPDGSPLFRGLDLAVAPGEAVAVVGPPGSGKSTLAAVLAGLAPASRGTVELVDGATGAGLDVAHADLDETRSRIGIVFDDPFLYSDSIAANIALGPAADGLDATALRDRVERAARRAAAHDFISALPDGYDTVVGERGLTLSGGQRQRIALARAFFVDPPILVLDDATSAVDATTEAAILAELRDTPGRTLVLIAHRRSTLAPADRVVVLDGGRVVESGRPADVAARSPLFRSLMSDPATGAATAPDDVAVTAVPDRSSLWPEDTETRHPDSGDRVRPAAPPRAGRRGGGGVSSALGSMPATPALLEAVAELPPAQEDPRVDESEARAPDPRFSLRGLLRPVRGLLLLAIVAVAIDTAVGLAFPTLARLGVNAATDDRLSTLWATTAAGLVAVAVGWLALSATTITSTRAGERVLFRLRVRSYAHLQRLGLDYYERELSGRIMTRMTTDIDALSSFLQTGLSTTVIALLTIVGVAAALVVTDPPLGAIVLVALIPLAVATVVFQRVASRAYTRSRELVSAVNADFQENIAGLRTTTSYRDDSRARARFGDLAGQYVAARMVSQRAISLYFPFITLVSDLATAAAVGIGASQVASGQTQPGTIVAFVLYLGMLFSPVQQLSQVFDGYQQAVVGLRRIGDLLRTPSSLESDPATATPSVAVSTPGPSGHAELDAVRFRYAGAGDDALRGVDLDIPAGTSLALVGQTGAGKSTIVKLLARFYDPTEGSVRLDGRDIREVPLRAHRARLGVVPQEAHLFTGTIASNIAYGDPTATRERIEAAAAAVGALDVIAGMRGGMTHRVGERGQGLSAGQRQLIALARAELVDPDLLLLDEATATLDHATERRVLDAGRRLARSRTAVIVAHRLATAARADRIAVVADGRIVELGTHAELLSLNGRYRVLWDTGSATGPTPAETADAG